MFTTGELDRVVQAVQRVEQMYLRKFLFSGRTASCDLCGRHFDVEFLVAAHIKKRAVCTDSERCDVSNIVMSACKFGCDELFERGYISVADDGTLIVSLAIASCDEANAYARMHIVGKTFGRPIGGRHDYFHWHRTNSFRG